MTTREMTWNNNGAVETSKTLYVQIYGTLTSLLHVLLGWIVALLFRTGDGS